MCDPLTIAGMALTAGSTVANTMAANKVAKARSAAMSAERLRQQGFDREAEALQATEESRYKDFGTKQGQRGQQLGDYLAKAGTSDQGPAGPEPSDVLPASDSAVTVQETGKQKGAANQYLTQQGKALGGVRSFGDYLGDVLRLQGRDAGQIGQIGGFKRGSADVLPFELESAGHKGDSMKAFGDILNFGGSLAMGKGLQGDMGATGFPIAPIAGPGDLNADAVAGPWGASLGSPYPLRVAPSGRVIRGVGGLYAGSA
jgi:hypothetical protein